MIIAFSLLTLSTLIIVAVKIVAVANNSCCEYSNEHLTKQDLSSYEKGHKAYWDGADIKDVPDAQTEGWWDAQSEVMGRR